MSKNEGRMSKEYENKRDEIERRKGKEELKKKRGRRIGKHKGRKERREREGGMAKEEKRMLTISYNLLPYSSK